jgi:hypothetical protein
VEKDVHMHWDTGGGDSDGPLTAGR